VLKRGPLALKLDEKWRIYCIRTSSDGFVSDQIAGYNLSSRKENLVLFRTEGVKMALKAADL
jgi:hypothetical protein